MSKMSRLMWLVVGVVVLAAGGAGAADDPKVAPEAKIPPKGWKEFQPKNKAYVAWFPTDGKLEESDKSIILKGAMQLRFYRAVLERKDGSVFGVATVRIPPQLAGPKPTEVKARQDLFRDLFVEEVGGKLVEQKKIKVGTMGGVDYTIETPKGMARLRLLGKGIVMYRIVVIGTKAQAEGKDADTFIGAFRHVPFKTTKKPE